MVLKKLIKYAIITALSILLLNGIFILITPIVLQEYLPENITIGAFTLNKKQDISIERNYFSIDIDTKIRTKNIDLKISINPMRIVMINRSVIEVVAEDLALSIVRTGPLGFSINEEHHVSLEGAGKGVLTQLSNIPFEIIFKNLKIDYTDKNNDIRYQLNPKVARFKNNISDAEIIMSSLLNLSFKQQIAMNVTIIKKTSTLHEFSLYGLQLPLMDIIRSLNAQKYFKDLKSNLFLNIEMSGKVNDDGLQSMANIGITNTAGRSLKFKTHLHKKNNIYNLNFPTISISEKLNDILTVSSFSVKLIDQDGTVDIKKMTVDKFNIKPFDIKSLGLFNYFIQDGIVSTIRGDLSGSNITIKNASIDSTELIINGNIAVKSFIIPQYFKVEGLDISISSVPGEVRFSIVGRQLRLMVFELFKERYFADSLSGVINLRLNKEKYDITSELFTLTLDDQVMTGFFSITQEGNKSPYMKLALATNQFGLTSGIQLIPREILDPYLVQWLDKSVLSGEATNFRLNYHGNLFYSLPSAGKEILNINFNYHEADIQFDAAWPTIYSSQGEFSFSDNKLNVGIHQAEHNEVQLKGAVTIYDFKKQILNAKIGYEGPASQIKQFINNSPLRKNLSGLNDISEYDGRLNGYVDTSFSLSSTSIDNTIFNGLVNLDLQGYTLWDGSYHMSNVAGLIYFDNESIVEGVITGLYDNEQAILAVTTKREGPNQSVILNGQIKTSLQNLSGYPNIVDAFQISGKTVLDMNIDIPLQVGGQRSPDTEKGTTLKLSGNGIGIQINQENQLAKQTNDERDILLSAVIKDNKIVLDIAMENTTRGTIQLVTNKSITTAPIIGVLEVGKLSKKLLPVPNNVLQLNIDVDKFNFDPWIDYTKTDNNQVDGVNLNVTIQSNKVLYNSVTVNNGMVKIQSSDDWFNLTLDSKEIIGELGYEKKKDRLFKINIDRLILGERNFIFKINNNYNPIHFPRIIAECNYCKVNDMLVKNIFMESNHIAGGVLFSFLSKETLPLQHLKGRLIWKYNQNNNRYYSELVLDVESGNAGQLLESLGLPKIFDHSSGTSDIYLNWAGNPYALDIESLDGTININLKDGELSVIDATKTGRLISLLNLTKLPGRLLFDFKDVDSAEDNTSFSKLEAKFDFNNGIASTTATEIIGSFGSIYMNGNFNFNNQTLDANALIIPEISSILPIISGLLWGLPLLFSTIVVDEILDESGVDINQYGALRYKVTGTFANPNLHKIEK